MNCSKITSRGTCTRPVVDGSHYCSLHSKSQDLLTAYNLVDPDLKESIKHHARGSLADISQQIVLLRAMVERRLNLAGDDPASKISAMTFASGQLGTIASMTKDMLKLSRDAGDLMSREDVEEVVDHIVQIVAEELRAASVADTIVDRIAERIETELSDDPS